MSDQGQIYSILNTRPDSNRNHEFDKYMYESRPVKINSDIFIYKSKDFAWVPLEDTFGKKISEVKKKKVNIFEIFYRYIVHPKSNDVPWFILIHGVPSNSRMKIGIMERLAPFGSVFSIDLLGMGESSKPIGFDWKWSNHVPYLDDFISMLKKSGFTTNPHIQGDDWGGGVALAYASERSQISSLTLVNPVALDGYPVQEIETIGRMSNIPSEQFDATNMGFPSTVQQILKSMVYHSDRMNSYTEEDFLFPYVESQRNSGRSANENMINSWNIYVLAQFASMLNPELLLPLHGKEGIDYSTIEVNVNIIWGVNDNMMPYVQCDKLAELFVRLSGVRTEITEVPKAGHFSEMDDPDMVARSMIRFFRNETKGYNWPLFFGNNPNSVYKGSERKEMRKLEKIGFASKHN